MGEYRYSDNLGQAWVDLLRAKLQRVRGTYHDTITTEIVGELTQQLDGIRPDGPAIFVLAASNRVDAIDRAILSRFVEQIEIGLPDEFQRKQLLEVFLRGVSADNISEIAEQLALVTADYSGRDLQQLVSRAILTAVKRSGNANTFKLKRSDFCPVGASRNEDKDMACSAQRESRVHGT